jgi:uncharacterized protein
VAKEVHEIRDTIHVFVRLDSQERRVVDSRPFQRLRDIHQLALTYLVYPGATHRRFEHALGVMQLAGQVFDVVTCPDAITDQIKELAPEIARDDERRYWRRVLRMAALCHDIGHLPFSHAAEDELLPEGWDHERLTKEIILSKEMCAVWDSQKPPLKPVDVMKLAVGPKKAKDHQFSMWEELLSEIIVGDAFGVDRIDYLLRDAHHAGVAYGRFDHHRLIDTLRILPAAPADKSDRSTELALGVEEGGLHSAEALLLARYFMWSQLYFHPIRRIYDIHLCDFLKEWLPHRKFSTDLETHLRMSDSAVIVALQDAASEPTKPGHDSARRIASREHFRRVYDRNPDDGVDAGSRVKAALCAKHGDEAVRHDSYRQKGSAYEFPVLMGDGRTSSSTALSTTLRAIPLINVDRVYVRPDLAENSRDWIGERRHVILAEKEGVQ